MLQPAANTTAGRGTGLRGGGADTAASSAGRARRAARTPRPNPSITGTPARMPMGVIGTTPIA